MHPLWVMENYSPLTEGETIHNSRQRFLDYGAVIHERCVFTRGVSIDTNDNVDYVCMRGLTWNAPRSREGILVGTTPNYTHVGDPHRSQIHVWALPRSQHTSVGPFHGFTRTVPWAASETMGMWNGCRTNERVWNFFLLDSSFVLNEMR